MTWKQDRWLVLDTETTGLHHHDRIIELGALIVQDGIILYTMGTLLYPGLPIPEEATAVHGITNADVEKAPTLEDIAPFFLPWVIDTPVIVGYNLPFDLGMLQRQLGYSWETAIEGKLLIDPLVLVRLDDVGRYWRGKGRHKLESVAKRLDVAPVTDAHRAVTDCVMALGILNALLDKLPDSTEEAQEFIDSHREAQEQNFQEWKAKQERRPT